MSVAFLLRWQKHLQINFPLIFKSASTSLQKMLPSLPYFLWEQAQHTPSLRLPIFCTSSAEEHRDYWQPPPVFISLHSSQKQVLESLEISHAMLDEIGENDPFFCISAHNISVLPFSDPASGAAVMLCLQHCPQPECLQPLLTTLST